MTSIHHPIRDAKVRTYRGDEDCIAILHGFPSPFFRGATCYEASDKAEAFRKGVLDQHEAAFIARQEAAAKARETAKARKARGQQDVSGGMVNAGEAA
ncbi:MAG: hypothetical protein Unbinned3696contig1008_26 [Prokaryotic dsDNA virus sp.]|nr:MAG: hypothetical protein Unbinned3696contig1008_26 [Prokaryotic dsDNA virus sp.]|tara:strand:+ start:2666 stop:2959 length:294 start_codon:yes stop_codon:yes gene_type:complete